MQRQCQNTVLEVGQRTDLPAVSDCVDGRSGDTHALLLQQDGSCISDWFQPGQNLETISLAQDNTTVEWHVRSLEVVN